MLDLSVIILNYRSRAWVKNCLRSIYDSTHGVSFEVIVVDNDSGDDIEDLIHSEFPEARFIGNKSNLGFARANNQAVARSGGEFVVFMNPDTFLFEDALSRLVGHFRANPRVGVIGGKLFNLDGTLQPSCINFPTICNVALDKILGLPLFPRRLAGRFLHRFWSHDRAREAEWMHGAFLGVRREMFEELGGFDSEFFLYGEDADLCHQARARGWGVLFVPDVRLMHWGDPVWTVERKLRNYRALFRLYEKHCPRWKAIALRLGMAAFFAAMLFGCCARWIVRIPQKPEEGFELCRRSLHLCLRSAHHTEPAQVRDPALLERVSGLSTESSP